MQFLKQFFIWWNSQTIGTRIFTWRNGIYVGSDEKGNLFYKSRNSDRRWVIYKNNIEASLISSEWHGWLHHTVKIPPSGDRVQRKEWEKPHLENKSGSDLAYHPSGRDRSNIESYTDYQAWSPENDN